MRFNANDAWRVFCALQLGTQTFKQERSTCPALMMATLCDGMRCELIQLQVLVLESGVSLRLLHDAAARMAGNHRVVVYLQPARIFTPWLCT